MQGFDVESLIQIQCTIMYGCDSCLERCRTLNKVHRNFLSPLLLFFPSSPSSPHLFCYLLRNCIVILSISSKNTVVAHNLLFIVILLLCTVVSSYLLLLAVLNLSALQIREKLFAKQFTTLYIYILIVILPLFPLSYF